MPSAPAALIALSLFMFARSASADARYAADSLLGDVERIVSDTESSGWFVDDDALQDARRALLESVCRTPPESRALALGRLEQASRAAGSARSLYEAEGRKLTAVVVRARFVEREVLALKTAMSWAERDCPFWVEPEPGFRGLQTDRDRFALSVESAGNVQIRRTAGTTTIGAGGLGRLLVARGFGGRYSLLAGFEFGGNAMLRPGAVPTEFVVNYLPALPVVFRIHQVAWHYEVELAPVALFQADNGAFSFGGRVGVGIGVSSLRTRGVIAWAGLSLAYERYVASGHRPSADFLRSGLGVGVIWDG